MRSLDANIWVKSDLRLYDVTYYSTHATFKCKSMPKIRINRPYVIAIISREGCLT